MSGAPKAAPAPASIEADRYQIHLAGKGHSGRVVGYRLLTIDQIDHNERQAAQGLGETGTIVALRAAASKLGVEAMIVEVSEPVAADKRHEAKPRGISPPELAEKFSQLFTTRDAIVLRRIYAEENMVTEEEVLTIFSGKVPVAG